MDDILFEVTDLKQWNYCPRVVYYRYCVPDIRPVTALMELGSAEHRHETGREERRSLRSYGLTEGERAYDLPLRSTWLGLRGRVDLAIAVPERSAPHAEGIVVEYKYSEQKAGIHLKLQLTAYALMLEETWDLPVKRGFIYAIPLRRAESVTITKRLRQKVVDTVATMQEMVQGEQMPTPPTTRRQCVSCEFRRFCNDVV